jgi:N-acetyl-gamma-glutamyl-phosphate reductase common form
VPSVGIAGASGMIGMQLTRLLSAHEKVTGVRVFSASRAGALFSTMHPAFRDLSALRFQKPSEAALEECEVLYLCVADYSAYLSHLKQRKGLVIDLGSGFRVAPVEEETQAAGVGRRFVSVVPEINPSQLTPERWIAAQGCVSTAVAIGLYPLLRSGLLAANHVTVDAKVASSGAGHSGSGEAGKHFNRVNGVRAYRLLDEHRHGRELAHFFRAALGAELSFDVNVFSVDLVRGISAALYVQLQPGVGEKQVRHTFNDAYGHQRLVRVLKLNSGEEAYPNPKWLYGTGLCEVGFKVHQPSGRAVVIAALDNLMKGGASQGVQILNLALGVDPAHGIPSMPIYP